MTTRLPVPGSDTGTWGGILNDYLTKTAPHNTALGEDTAVGATSMTVATVPQSWKVGNAIAIDLGTTECEVRAITAIAGNVVSWASYRPLRWAHTAGDRARLLLPGDAYPHDFGLKGDGSDEWLGIQRMFNECSPYGVPIFGGGTAHGPQFQAAQPIVMTGSIHFHNISFKTHSSWYGATDAVNTTGNQMAWLMPFAQFGASPVTFEADNNTVIWATPHQIPPGYVGGGRIAFNAPYGETLPASIVPGRLYWIKTIPSETTITLAENSGTGPEFDITTDGSATSYPLVGAMMRGYADYLRIDLTIPNVGGIIICPQQPHEIHNFRLHMDADATTEAIGIYFHALTQISNNYNFEVNANANCHAVRFGGTGNHLNGFNATCANHPNAFPIVVAAFNTVIDGSIWLEGAGGSTQSVGIKIEGGRALKIGTIYCSWLAKPVVVSGAPHGYSIDGIYNYSGGAVMIDDQYRGFQIKATSIGEPGDFDSDESRTIYNFVQPAGLFAPTWQPTNRYVAVSAAYTARRIDGLIDVNATGAPRTITLPTAVNWRNWQVTIRKSDASTNSVTIDPNGTETIDGATTYVLANQYESVTLKATGANWVVVAKSGEPFTPPAGQEFIPVDYLMRDTFSVAEAAPMFPLRNTEYGGPLKVFDLVTGADMSVSGGAMQLPRPTGGHGFVNTYGYVEKFKHDREPGLMGYCRFTAGYMDRGGPMTWAGSSDAYPAIGLAYNVSSINYGDAGPYLAPGITAGIEYQLATIIRSTGALYLIKGGIYTDWTLLVVRIGPEVFEECYLAGYNFNAAFTINEIAVLQKDGILADMYGKTLIWEPFIDIPYTATAAADGCLAITWTPKTDQVLRIEFRRTDADNLYYFELNATTYTVRLFRRESGFDTELDSGHGNAFGTDGRTYRPQIMLHGPRIVTHIEGHVSGSMEGPMALNESFNLTATGIRIASTEIGNVANLEFWPRTFLGTDAKDIG